jgi:hypothetical protein
VVSLVKFLCCDALECFGKENKGKNRGVLILSHLSIILGKTIKLSELSEIFFSLDVLGLLHICLK